MLALIPARGGSKGLPGKNIRPMAGKPMIVWSIEAALKAESVDRVVVSTDCEEIAGIARDAGAEVPFLRPAELATDTAQAVDAYIYTCDRLATEGTPIETLCVLQPTSPLRGAREIDEAAAVFRAHGADSVISVCESEPLHLVRTLDADGVLRPLDLPGLRSVANRQDMPTTWLVNGALLVLRYAFLRAARTYYSDRTWPYVMPRIASLDVDTLEDFELCELVKQR